MSMDGWERAVLALDLIPPKHDFCDKKSYPEIYFTRFLHWSFQMEKQEKTAADVCY